MTSLEQPLRFPDLASPKFMTRRAWWLVVVNVLFPGAAQVLAGNRRLGRFGMGATLTAWAIVVLALLLGVLWRPALISIVTFGPVLFLGQVLLVGYAVLWLVLTLDTLRLVRVIKTAPRARAWIAVSATVLMVFFSGTAAYAAFITGGVNTAISQIFTPGPSVEPINGHYNFLVIGTDTDPQREAENMGMRSDTTQVISIDANTGAATIIGLPRDLHDIPFPAASPLASVYPEGYTEYSAEYCVESACLNTIMTDVNMNYADLYPQAATDGVPAGVFGMMDAASGVTGLPIQFYVVIDMPALVTLIDALGGVDIIVPERTAIAEPDTAEEDVPEWIESGPQHLDGYHAVMFARTRWSGTGDYDRMVRQQLLQESLLAQVNPGNVLAKFQDIAVAGTSLLKTNVPQTMLGYFVDLGVKTKSQPLTHIALTPFDPSWPVDPLAPDYPGLQSYLQSVLFPPAPSTSPDAEQ
jgi:LCP family protein required for cell wall assembly